MKHIDNYNEHNKESKMGKINIAIGDWSEDGHNISENFTFEVNKDVSEMRQAYKDSCKKTGIQFNHNQKYGGNILVCVEYLDGRIPRTAFDILEKEGIRMSYYCNRDRYVEDPEQFAKLILEFIKLSLPDLEYKQVGFLKSEKVPFLNGYWNKELNVQFGYGLFD